MRSLRIKSTYCLSPGSGTLSLQHATSRWTRPPCRAHATLSVGEDAVGSSACVAWVDPEAETLPAAHPMYGLAPVPAERSEAAVLALCAMRVLGM